MPEDPPEVKAAHDLTTALRAEGYSVGFSPEDVVEDFDTHVDRAHDQLDVDDLSAFFVVAHRDGRTDYASSVIVRDGTVYGITQIEMLGAHFRTVLDALPLDTTDLIDAMVDEALVIEPDDEGDETDG